MANKAKNWKEKIGDWLFGMMPDLDQEDTITPLARIEEWDAVKTLPKAVLYKHSPVCSLSAVAFQEIQHFTRENPEVPVFFVDVMGKRKISNAIESELAVRHESPQVFVLAKGKVCWHESHTRVIRQLIQRALRTPC